MKKKSPLHVFNILNDPFQRFFQTETSGGILLIIAFAIALIWANSRWSQWYQNIISYKLTFQLGELFYISKSLLLWINDGLMAIFFFVIGLEIKREILTGELSEFKKASLPVIAAIGGMVVPALIFIGMNHNKPGAEGWGIPMATDIAFSLGILRLLGKKVPISMKVFLTSLAIVDDVGAIIIIAVFYSMQIYWTALFIGLGLITLLIIGNLIGIRNIPFYIITGFVIWYFFLKSGIHPTLSGVLLAFVIPANRKIRIPMFINRLNKNLAEFSATEPDDDILLNPKQLDAVDNMEYYIQTVQSPLQRLERSLHGFVTWFVIPVFVLANAGIIFTGGTEMSGIDSLTISVAVSLFAGKLIGVFGFTYIFVKLGFAELSGNLRWGNYIGLGFLSGVGFTMSIFISTLAFTDKILINHAEMGVLFGSLLAGICGYIILRLTLKDEKANSG